MKKILGLLLACFALGATSCGPKPSSILSESVSLPGASIGDSVGTSSGTSLINSGSTSTSEPDKEVVWSTELDELMLQHLGVVLPFIQLGEGYTYEYLALYNEITIRDTSGEDFSIAYSLILGDAGFLTNPDVFYEEYITDDLYVVLYFDSWEQDFYIYAGTRPKPLTEWDGELSALMMEKYGVIAPISFTDKSSYYYDSELNEIYLSDSYSAAGDYANVLLENGYTYISSNNYFDFYYVFTPLHADKVFTIGVGLYDSSVVFGLIDMPSFSDEWDPGIISAIDTYFGISIPVFEVSEYTVVQLDTVLDELMLLDPFTGDITESYHALLIADQFVDTGGVDEYGLSLYTKGDGYVRMGYLQGFGFAIIVGTTAEPVIATAWNQDTLDLLNDVYGESIPVAPVSETYDYGTQQFTGEVYISDFKCGDIKDEYAAVLLNDGYEFIRTESDGFDRYDGENLSVFIQYFDQTDIFEIWVSLKPAVITEWNASLTEVMLYRLGVVIPVAPLYNDEMASFNATDGAVFIMDSSALDIREEYDVILRAAGYEPLDEENLDEGYVNDVLGIKITIASLSDFGGIIIYASIVGTPPKVSEWDTTLSGTMVDVLGEVIPLAPITNHYFGFETIDYETNNKYLQVYDYYWGDATEGYTTILNADANYEEITLEEAYDYLSTNYPYESMMMLESSIEYKCFMSDEIILIYGYDAYGELLMRPSFVISAFLVNPVADDGGGGTIIF